MSNFIEDVVIPVAKAVGIGAAIFGAFAFVADSYARYQCNNFHEATGKEVRYMTLDICYIKTESGWQRWDEYKMRAAASERLSALDD